MANTSRRYAENAGSALAALMSKRSTLSVIALVLVLVAVFWMRPNIARYNGVRLLLNLSPVLIFTALAQMFIMTASDIDLSIGSFVALVNVIVAGIAKSRIGCSGAASLCRGLRPNGSLDPLAASTFDRSDPGSVVRLVGAGTNGAAAAWG